MATSYPTAIDSATAIAALLERRHDPAQHNLLLQTLIDAVLALEARAGTTAGGVLTDLINESTAAAGVTIDGVLAKDGGVTLSTGQLLLSRAATTGSVILSAGGTASEGWFISAVEQTVSHAANAALSIALDGGVIGANSVILSAQANIQSALTGGGTTTKVGLGISSDPDKYGKTGDLLKNTKINTMPDWAVLGSPETLGLYACANDGSAGDTALTVGSVRVRIIYATLVSLTNAA